MAKGKAKKVEIDVAAMAKAALEAAQQEAERPTLEVRRAQEKAERDRIRSEIITAITPAVRTLRDKRLTWPEVSKVILPTTCGIKISVREMRIAIGEDKASTQTAAGEGPRRGRPKKAVSE